MQLLEREKGGAYIVLVRHKLTPVNQDAHEGQRSFWVKGGYVVSREIWSGQFRMTFLGSVSQIRDTLKAFNKSGIHHHVMSLTDEKFSPNSPLNVLTEKQRRILTAAYKLGYYNLPRKISSRQLSDKMGLHKSALATHIRKAESRLIGAVLSET